MLPRQSDVRFTAVVLVLAILALAFSAWLIVDPPIPLSGDLLAMSPRVFPLLILVGTVVVAAAFLVDQARQGVFKTRGIPGGIAAPGPFWRQVAFLIITISCALLLNSLGFIATMFLLMASTAVLVGNRSVFQILGISIVIPVSFFIIVTHMLRTALPEVDLVQRTLGPLINLLPAF